MKAKKSQASKSVKNNSITARTWILFGIFLVTSYICLKVVFTAQQVTNSIVYPTPVVVHVPTKAVTPVHKTVKR